MEKKILPSKLQPVFLLPSAFRVLPTGELRIRQFLLDGNHQDEVFAAPGTCVRVNEDRTGLTSCLLKLD